MKNTNLFGGIGYDIPEEFYIPPSSTSTKKSTPSVFIDPFTEARKRIYKKAKIIETDDGYVVTTKSGIVTTIVVGDKDVVVKRGDYYERRRWNTHFEALQDAKDWAEIARDEEWS